MQDRFEWKVANGDDNGFCVLPLDQPWSQPSADAMRRCPGGVVRAMDAENETPGLIVGWVEGGEDSYPNAGKVGVWLLGEADGAVVVVGVHDYGVQEFIASTSERSLREHWESCEWTEIEVGECRGDWLVASWWMSVGDPHDPHARIRPYEGPLQVEWLAVENEEIAFTAVRMRARYVGDAWRLRDGVRGLIFGGG